MPSLGFGEIIILVLIALLVFGPKRLPEIGRTVGKSMREFRRAASDLRAELETDLDDERPTFPARTTRERRTPPTDDPEQPSSAPQPPSDSPPP